MQAAIADVRAYLNGTCSLFTPLSAERLQEERQQKEAAKQKRSPEMEAPLVDDLAAAARALSRKKPAKTKETTDGQLTFDFMAARTVEPEEASASVPDVLEPERRESLQKEAADLLEQRGLAVSEELIDQIIDGIDKKDATPAAIAGQVEETLRRDEEEAILSQYDLGYGHMGNGLTVWNRLEEVDGDYKTIAHIAPDRTVCSMTKTCRI